MTAYLDCAATSMQKPRAVIRAMAYSTGHMASPGRGGHRPAMRAGETVYACRQEAMELFHVPQPEQVVFTFNATHGLNIAMKSLIKPGDTVLISGYEHNAVTRPLAAIPDVTVKSVKTPLFQSEAFLEEFRQQLTGEVTAVVCTHVSNVFGYILPIYEVAELCAEQGVPLIVDASQSAGCLPVRMDQLKAAFVAMPGHKGLFGPQGTGILLCGHEAVPLLEGGTGSRSALQTMPDFLPDRLEAGTHNVCGIAGLLEGIRFVRRMGTQRILTHEKRLIGQAVERLSTIPGVHLMAAPGLTNQSGVCSFWHDRIDCEVLGNELGARGIAVRAGLHCAPRAHETAGTLDRGTVRFSVSPFNNRGDLRRFENALRQCVNKV